MTDVTDREPNRTEPNRWPTRMGGSDAIPRTGARARIAEVGEGSTATESDRVRFLDRAREYLIGDAGNIWPATIPTAEDLARYGAEGQQLSPASRLRPLAKLWARIGILLSWTFYARAWVAQRFLRFIALVAVIVLVNLFIPGTTPRWAWAFLIGFLL